MLGFVRIRALIDGERVSIRTLLAIVRRDDVGQLRVLTLTSDPISIRLVGRPLELSFSSGPGSNVPPAELVTADGTFPEPSGEARFSDFFWRRPQCAGAAFEIAEFNYGRGSRLFHVSSPSPGEARLSTGDLWSTRGPWQWRIWTVAQDGSVIFSKIGHFDH